LVCVRPVRSTSVICFVDFKLRLIALTTSSTEWKETFDGQTPDNNYDFMRCTTTAGPIRAPEQLNLNASRGTTNRVIACEEHWPVRIRKEPT